MSGLSEEARVGCEAPGCQICILEGKCQSAEGPCQVEGNGGPSLDQHLVQMEVTQGVAVFGPCVMSPSCLTLCTKVLPLMVCHFLSVRKAATDSSIMQVPCSALHRTHTQVCHALAAAACISMCCALDSITQYQLCTGDTGHLIAMR